MVKTVREIKESSGVSKDRRFTTLVRAGLFDVKQLPLLKRALDKDTSKISPKEKQALRDLLDNIMSQVLGNQGVYQKVRQGVMTEDVILEGDDAFNRVDIPAVLVLKRRAIRLYPDGQKVALYYTDKLNKFVTIPFQGIGISEDVESLDETTVDYEDEDIDQLAEIYENLSDDNKEIFEAILEDNPTALLDLIK